MTRTEERLRDALGAAAARVKDDRLRPLPTLEAKPRRHTPRTHKAWLAPVAAALSVLLVIALAVTLAHSRHHQAPSSPYPALPAGFPRYFAEIGAPPRLDVVIRSTSTGAEITTAMTPDIPDWQLTPESIAAAPDGRTFYIAYYAVNTTATSRTSQTWIYQLTWSHGGSANALNWIRGDPIPGGGLLANGPSMTVSPDGTRLALTAASPARQRDQNSRSWPDEIIVIDLRTGARTVWQDGLSRPGQTFTIPRVSWAPDSRSLAFLAIWCRPTPNSGVCLGTPGRLGYRGTQVRSLDLTTKGGTLGHSAMRLAQDSRYPVIADAVAGRNGELTLAVLSGSAGDAQLTVERVAANGARLGVLYRSRAYNTVGRPASVTLTPDATGRYLMLTYDSPDGLVSGWVDHGKLRFLPAEHPVRGLPITAW
jgi:hypothetical protein